MNNRLQSHAPPPVPPYLGSPLPTSVEAEVGEAVSVSCDARGRPQPTATWQRLLGETREHVERFFKYCIINN